MDDRNEKLVEFENWCSTCKYKDEVDDPTKETKCDECLSEPARLYSHKPVNYVEAK